MSCDLQGAFTGIKGFSVRNVQYMRQWFQIWSVVPANGQHLVAQITWGQNNTVVEYALKDIHKPMGVSEYTITRNLPDELKSSLPSIEEIEAELEGVGYDG